MADTDIENLTRADVPDDWTELDRRTVDTIRVLAADAVEKVGNGHPGTAMALAPRRTCCSSGSCATTRTTRPGWAATASSCPPGTTSLTLYIQLYLSGYAITLDDLKRSAPSVR